MQKISSDYQILQKASAQSSHQLAGLQHEKNYL